MKKLIIPFVFVAFCAANVFAERPDAAPPPLEPDGASVILDLQLETTEIEAAATKLTELEVKKFTQPLAELKKNIGPNVERLASGQFQQNEFFTIAIPVAVETHKAIRRVLEERPSIEAALSEAHAFTKQRSAAINMRVNIRRVEDLDRSERLKKHQTELNKLRQFVLDGTIEDARAAAAAKNLKRVAETDQKLRERADAEIAALEKNSQLVERLATKVRQQRGFFDDAFSQLERDSAHVLATARFLEALHAGEVDRTKIIPWLKNLETVSEVLARLSKDTNEANEIVATAAAKMVSSQNSGQSANDKIQMAEGVQ